MNNTGYMDVFSQDHTRDKSGMIISCLTTAKSIYEKWSELDKKFTALLISDNYMFRIVPFQTHADETSDIKDQSNILVIKMINVYNQQDYRFIYLDSNATYI